MDFLYQETITQNNLTDCPPATYIPIDRVLFRAVFPEGEDHFQVYPERVTIAKENDVKCKHLGLSFFDTEEQCKKLLHGRNLGTHVAHVRISPEEGTAEMTPNKKGHITFHPSVAFKGTIEHYSPINED